MFEALVQDLRVVLRVAGGRQELPAANQGFVLLPRRWVVDAVLGGRPPFAGAPATMNSSPPLSPASTSSPSLS